MKKKRKKLKEKNTVFDIHMSEHVNLPVMSKIVKVLLKNQLFQYMDEISFFNDA